MKAEEGLFTLRSLQELPSLAPKTKVIVFSQFWIHINLVRTHLMKHRIQFAIMRAGLPASEKIEALEDFKVSFMHQAQAYHLMRVILWTI